MNAAVLIRQLAQAGIRLSPKGGKLRVEAKPGTLTPDLRDLIANRKNDLLAALDHAPQSARDERQIKVEARLRASPELRLVFDVADAVPTAATDKPVSVLLAVRHGEHILSGELHIPRQRWNTAVFVGTVDPGTGYPS